MTDTAPQDVLREPYLYIGGQWSAGRGADLEVDVDRVVGAGALPAMLSTGRLVDRWGPRTAAAALAALGIAGLVVAMTAHDLATLDRMLEIGVTGIISDETSVLTELLGR